MKKKGLLVGVSALAIAGLTTALTSCGKTATYTVKFYDGTTEYDSKTVTSGYNVEVPVAPTSDGKIFNGWYSDEALTTPFDFGSIVEKDTQVYAAWVNRYSVTFKDGDSVLKTEKVTSGQNVQLPETPTKTDRAFNGWYLDKAFKQPYDFGSIVTGDVTLYASFVSATDPKTEFRATFMVDGEVVDSTLTFHQKLEEFAEVQAPAGKEFAGWWVSDYQDSSKLTYQFDINKALTQDVILFAVFKDANKPLVSVEGNKISWDSKGVNKEYSINIKDADDQEADAIYSSKTSTTYRDYNFDNLPAGNYLIEVTCGDYTGKAYYNNKGLDRVNIFVDDFVVSWNEVQGATSYKLTIDNGIKANKVTIELQNVNSYDFSNVPMTASGIKFTVEASAEGKSSSVKEYTLSRVLGKVTNLSVDATSELLTWDDAGADKYKVQIVVDGKTQTYYTNNNEFSLANFNGEIKYSVSQYADGYYSYIENGNYTKATLAAPKNVQLSADGNSITWDAVTGAVKYAVRIGNALKEVDTNSYVLTDSDKAAQNMALTIQAIAEDAANNSSQTEFEYSKNQVMRVEFNAGVLSWSPVLGASKYALVIDNSDAIIVETTKYQVQLESGNHTYKVAVANADGTYDETKFKTYENTIYNLVFETNGGEEIAKVAYENGTEIVLPMANYPGYTFTGWYKSNDNYVNNEFTDTVFNSDEDITIYAGWVGENFKVTLNYDIYVDAEDITVTEVETTFGSSFALPVPTSENPLKAFGGWYAELNGQGEKYTDEFGNSIRNWRDFSDVTLYAGWLDVFEFEEIDNGQAYSVKQGRGISLLTEITIPSSYLGKPVTTVEAGAFQGCSTLKTVNIPNSITNIEVGFEGPNAGGNCFQSCSKLEEINVFEVEGVHEEDIKYESINGVLLSHEITGDISLAYVPYGTISGIYTVPSKVTLIPQKAFKSCTKIEEIIVPASVVEIGEEAFASCSKLTKVTFLAAEEGVEEKELKLGAKTFSINSALVELNLPARIATFNPEMINSCSKLEAINITGDYANAKYASLDGIVVTADKTEIIFCPRGKGGDYITPVGVTKIADGAFKSNTNLVSLMISGQVSYIGKDAFNGCSKITSLIFQGVSDDVPLTIKESAFYGCSSLTNLILPANLVNMEKNAFGNTSKLTNVTVLSSSADINFETNAFATTASVFYVTNLTIGKDVHTFEVTGVFGSTKLINVLVNPKNEYYTAVDDVLYDKNITKVIYYPTEKVGAYQLPATITSIGARVFEGKSITEISFPKTVTNIGESAFYNCTKLEKITFEAGEGQELVLGNEAFRSCSALTELVLSERIKTISKGAFYGCSSIETITIPDSVTVIGDEAFRNCNALKTIALPASLQELVEDKGSTDTTIRVHTFDFCKALESITISDENTNYKTIDGVLYRYEKDTDGSVKGLALLKCPQGQKGVINVAEDVILVNKYAFYETNAVTKVIFQDTEKEVVFDTNTFYWIDNIEEIVLPKGLKEMPDNMIYYCQKLTSITIPNTVEKMSAKAFGSCYKLAEVIFEEGGTKPLEIGTGTYSSGTGGANYSGMFYNNKAIKSLILPERTTKIGDYAFSSDTTGSSSSASSDYSCSLETVVIPSTVTSIGQYAFYGCKIKSLTFTDGTADLKIGKDAFYKIQATTLELPSNLVSLGDYAFGYSTTLETVSFHEGLETIGAYTFYTCNKLKEVNIPSSVTTIGNYAFSNDSKLENINFKADSKLKTISAGAFKGCSIIKTISIPQTVEKIDNMAFEACSSLKNVVWVGSNTEEGASLKTLGYQVFKSTALEEFSFPYCGKDSYGKVNKIAIPTGNTVNMFEACKSLTTVHLSASVASIDKMFAKCSSIKNVTIDSANENFSMAEGKPIILNLEGTVIKYAYGRLNEIVIPDGITEIGPYAFSGQTDIESIVLPKTLKTIGTYAFNNCVGLKSVVFETGSVIDKIDTYAFNGCTSLESIVLPDTITTLLNYTFCSCAGLKSVKLPKNLTTIGQYAFAHTLSLETIELPDTLTKIDQYAFVDSGLKEITITKNIATLGIYAFQKCYDLEKITINSTKLTSANQWFNYCSSLKEVVFADGITTLGGYMFQYDTDLEEIVLPEGLKEIPNYLFDGCTSLKSIVIPASVTKIGTYAFRNCTSLESVTFEEGSKLTTIDTYSFNACTVLKSIELPTTLTTLGNYAFMASGIESIVIPSSIKQIGTGTSSSTSQAGNVFQNCKELKTVVFPENLTTINSYSFDGCDSLESITIPAKVTRVDNNAFSNCVNLKSASILGTLTTYGTYMFANDTALTDVSIAATNTKTGTYMFQNCTALESIVLPTSLAATGLSTNIFDGCTALKSIEIPSKVTTIPNYCFRNCSSLETVTFKGSVATINTSAFENCVALKAIDASKVKTTGTASFKGCTSLTAFDAPILTTVGIECFQYTSLKSFFIPKTVTTFNGGALNTLTNCAVTSDPAARYQVFENMAVVDTKSGTTFGTLKTVFNVAPGAEIVIPDTVLKFETYAFENTVNLAKVTIPEGITAISNYCFRGCSSLEVVELPSTLKTFGTESFAGTALKEVIIPNGVTSLSSAFMNISTLEKVFIPKSVTSFGTTFQNCTALVDVEIEDGVVTLGSSMFKGCTALETIVIPGSVGEKITSTSTATYLFADCTSLKNVTLGEGIKFLPNYAFQNCTALENVTLPESLYSIGMYAFSNTGIKELVIPETVTNLSSYTYSYNEKLVSVTIPASLISGTYAFIGCTALENVTFAEGFRFSNAAGTSSMGSEMFTDCTSLKKVVLPSTALFIPNNCFKNCTALEEVVLNEGLTKIEYYAFRGCEKLSKITIPSTLTYMAYGAFADCTSIKSMYIPLECQIQVTSGVGNTPWDGWTAEQTVYVEGTLFDITGFWGEVNSSTGFFRYYTNNNATFVFGYEPEE